LICFWIIVDEFQILLLLIPTKFTCCAGFWFFDGEIDISLVKQFDWVLGLL
jgi:hypothetical protein